MRKKIIIIFGGLIVICLVILYLIFKEQNKFYAVYENGQIGIVTDNKNILINDNKIDVYKTHPNSIKIVYESLNLDNSYHNTININDRHEFALTSKRNENAVYHQNEISILGLNIIDGKLKLTFKSGTKYGNNYNTFSLRNIYILVDNKEIWSNEYPKTEYLNEPINFGENDLNDDFRFNYQVSKTLTFTVNNKFLTSYGYLLDDYHQEEIKVTSNGKEKIIQNKAYIGISCNITNNEIIDETRTIQVIKTGNVDSLTIKMDGIEIPNELRLTKDAWAGGEHTLSIEAINKYGFKQKKVINFILTEPNINLVDRVNYEVYQTGVTLERYPGIDKLGIKVNDNRTLQKDDEYLLTVFSKEPVINFIVEESEKTTLFWSGKAQVYHTVYMQLYNHETSTWESVSTKFVQNDENIILGYDYQGETKYIKDNLVYVRITSQIQELLLDNITSQIFHISDIQYIVQMLAKSGIDSVIGRQAKAALDSMVNYIINEYNHNQLKYFLFTGDFVQQQQGLTLEEWDVFKTYVLDPILEANVPLGVSSGNHDVGGISSYNSSGVNTLDDNLVYEYYSQYLGEDVFKDYDYFGEAFENNRSHYDLMTINEHEFLFLYLGWGSSTYGIHVSQKDITWAQTILEKYPDKTVILATHEYMSNKGVRNLTGEYVYNNLVKKYQNIKFVFSGHINGTSKRVDALDDDGDGINDRLVLQLLTNFQEEENLYGATFIRTIGLDFVNNLMYFNIYSPFFQDSDIILDKTNEYVQDAKEFYYSFDLNNVGYGLLTDFFG